MSTPSRPRTRWTLAAVAGVFVAAFAGSFTALYWVGTEGLGWHPVVAATIPLSVDGLAACAAAITVDARSRGTRAYAWCVFALALAISLAGNVAHAQQQLPEWLLIGFAAAPPVIVALGVHLYALLKRDQEPAQVPAPEPPPAPVVKTPSAPPKQEVVRHGTIPRLPDAEAKVRAEVHAREAAGTKVKNRELAVLLHEHGVTERVVTQQRAGVIRRGWPAPELNGTRS